VKDRFFNLERRFACYRRYLPDLDDAAEEDVLRQDAQWFQMQTGAITRWFSLVHSLIVFWQTTSLSALLPHRWTRAQRGSAQMRTDFGGSLNAP
jgi:hypothetical protein